MRSRCPLTDIIDIAMNDNPQGLVVIVFDDLVPAEYRRRRLVGSDRHEESLPRRHLPAAPRSHATGGMAVDENALLQKFESVSNSQESIQSLSLWLLHHKNHHKRIVETWVKVLSKCKFRPVLDSKLTSASCLQPALPTDSRCFTWPMTSSRTPRKKGSWYT